MPDAPAPPASSPLADHTDPADATMTALVARRYGGPEVLELDTIAIPEPAANQLLVEVRASSLNALDWHFLTGTPTFMRLVSGIGQPKRQVHGADVAGVVLAVGADVVGFAPGDEIFGECQGGGLAPVMAVEQDRVVVKPSSVSFDDAAATPVAGLTALQGLQTHAAVTPGDRVLVNGAAGGVGTFAVQIARALGGYVTAVCSGRNVEMVKALGADEVIDYETHDFVASGSSYEVIFDNVGNRSAKDYLGLLTPNGRYVVTTGPKTNRLLGPIPKILGTALRFVFAKPSFHQFTAEPNHADLETLGRFLESGDVVPQIDRVIGLDGVADGIAELATGHTRAKIVVHPSEGE